jgi:hypothetical protein
MADWSTRISNVSVSSEIFYNLRTYTIRYVERYPYNVMSRLSMYPTIWVIIWWQHIRPHSFQSKAVYYDGRSRKGDYTFRKWNGPISIKPTEFIYATRYDARPFFRRWTNFRQLNILKWINSVVMAGQCQVCGREYPRGTASAYKAHVKRFHQLTVRVKYPETPEKEFASIARSEDGSFHCRCG